MSDKPICGACGGVMTPETARERPELFLHDACLPDDLRKPPRRLPVIVAEVSKSWSRDEFPDSKCLAKLFEGVITTNRQRGYRLQSWRFHQVICPETLVETIIAVFEAVEVVEAPPPPLPTVSHKGGCPTCSHTMARLDDGSARPGPAHCERCGTVLAGGNVYVPKLVEAVRKFRATAKDNLQSGAVEALWHALGLDESTRRPEDRP